MSSVVNVRRNLSEDGKTVRYILFCFQEGDAIYNLSPSVQTWNETWSWAWKHLYIWQSIQNFCDVHCRTVKAWAFKQASVIKVHKCNGRCCMWCWEYANYFLTEVGDANTFKGIELERDPADRQAIIAIQASVVNAAMTFIQGGLKGWQQIQFCQQQLSWQTTEVGQLQTGICCSYMEKLKFRHGHFQVPLVHHNFSLQDCLDEWMSLKFHVQRVRGELELKQSDFWKNKFMLCKDDYPNLLILV